jgi:hypothetical protein
LTTGLEIPASSGTRKEGRVEAVHLVRRGRVDLCDDASEGTFVGHLQPVVDDRRLAHPAQHFTSRREGPELPGVHARASWRTGSYLAVMPTPAENNRLGVAGQRAVGPNDPQSPRGADDSPGVGAGLQYGVAEVPACAGFDDAQPADFSYVTAW